MDSLFGPAAVADEGPDGRVVVVVEEAGGSSVAGENAEWVRPAGRRGRDGS